MAQLQQLIAFLVNIFRGLIDVMNANIFLQYTLYLYILVIILVVYSVLWGGKK